MYRLNSSCLHRFLRVICATLVGVNVAYASGSISPLPSTTTQGRSGEDVERMVLTIAFPDTLVNPYDQFSLYETVEALREKLEAYSLKTVIFSAAEATEQLGRLKPDFIFAPSVLPLMADLEAVRIATRRMDTASDAAHSVGAAIVVRQNSTIRSLRDLKGATVMTALPTAIDGWLAALASFKKTNLDPERDFASIIYRNNAYPDVVSALLAGHVDVAVVPACLLETLEREGLADVSTLRVLKPEDADKKSPLACQYTTELYPDLSLMAMSTAPEGMVRDMTIGILSLPHTAVSVWLTNVSHTSVDALMHTLQIGPYAYLKDMSPSALYARHKTLVWLFIGLLAFLVFNEVRLHRLVLRRSSALARSMRERERLAKEAETIRMQMAGLERRSVVQQMSGMIAHEINAPVGAIRTWTAIARLKCPPDTISDQKAAEALKRSLEKIDNEAVRIADIVSRVRKYARREVEPAQVTSLVRILERAVLAYKAEENGSDHASIQVDLHNSPALVYGQPLEIEVLFLNLIRNAVGAMRAHPKHDTSEKNGIAVALNLGNDQRWHVTIENPGPALTAEALERLNARGASIITAAPSGEGLGLGLTICRGIADSHGASLYFEAGTHGGVRAVFAIDAVFEASEAME